jgi:hypothetical protein
MISKEMKRCYIRARLGIEISDRTYRRYRANSENGNASHNGSITIPR